MTRSADRYDHGFIERMICCLSQLKQVMRLIHVLQPVPVLIERIKAEREPRLKLAGVDRPPMRAVDLTALRAACVAGMNISPCDARGLNVTLSAGHISGLDQ